MINDDKIKQVNGQFEIVVIENMLQEVFVEIQEQQFGSEVEMSLVLVVICDDYWGSDKLKGKVVFISGGDSGIGCVVVVYFVCEGVDVVILYFDEYQDVWDILKMVQVEGCQGLIIVGDIGDFKFCQDVVVQVMKEFGKFDILVNNVVEQYLQENFIDIILEQFEWIFCINIFGMFYLIQVVLLYL